MTYLTAAQAAQQKNRSGGGQYQTKQNAEPAALSPTVKPNESHGNAPSLQERPKNPVKLRVPEGQFAASDVDSEWGRAAVRAGALRRYGVTGDELDQAAALVNDGRGGRQKAREAMSLNDAQLDELVATQGDLRRRKGPHFVNGQGSRKDWSGFTASGLGQVPLEPTGKEGVYRIPAPAGSNDTIWLAEGGMIEFTDAAGNTTETDGEGVNRILDNRKDSPHLAKYEIQFGAKVNYHAESGVLRVQAGEVSYAVGKDFEISGVAAPDSSAPGRFLQDLEPQARELHRQLADRSFALSESRRTPNRKDERPKPIRVETYVPEPTTPKAYPQAKRTWVQRIGRLFG